MADRICDIFVIGGGINGTGIARDAQGRGLKVTLAEMGDLASATSSASTKLFHGGLRYLEYFEIDLVKKALIERETLLKAMLLQALYSIRSERQLVERIGTDLLFRWFLDLSPEASVFHHTVFSHNRERLDEHGLVQRFFDGVVRNFPNTDAAREAATRSSAQ